MPQATPRIASQVVIPGRYWAVHIKYNAVSEIIQHLWPGPEMGNAHNPPQACIGKPRILWASKRGVFGPQSSTPPLKILSRSSKNTACNPFLPPNARARMK